MCIKIIKSKQEYSYNMEIPLEEQLKGSKQIVVNYDPQDPSVEKFLNEVERLCKHGITANLNIKFNHNNHILGARTRKEITKLVKELDLNEVIKLMVTMQSETDKKLEELSIYCLGEKSDV